MKRQSLQAPGTHHPGPPLPPLARDVLEARSRRGFVWPVALSSHFLTALAQAVASLTGSTSFLNSHSFLCVLILEKPDPHFSVWGQLLGKTRFHCAPAPLAALPWLRPPVTLSSFRIFFLSFSFVWFPFFFFLTLWAFFLDWVIRFIYLF